MCYEDKTKEELIEELRKKDKIIHDQSSKDNETILKAILESTADGILVLDYKEKVIHSNKRYKEIWRIPNKLLEERNGLKIKSYIKSQFLDPEKFILETNRVIKSSVEHTDRLYLKNGQVLERTFKPLLIDDKLSGMVWSFKEITQRVLLEKELIRSKTLYRKLIELLPDGILVYKDNKLFLINQAAAKLLKKPKREILGNPGGTIARIHPDYKEEANHKISELHNNEATMKYSEYKLLLHDGTEVEVETGGFSFRNEDEFFVTTIIKDITERKKIHQLEKTVSQKSELLKAANEYNLLKTQLFSTISHELKTPLNIIFGSVQLIEKLYANVFLDKYLKMMKQNCYRLLRLINNLIDVNKIEMGFYKLELKNCNIVKVIEDITLSVVDYTKSKDIELVFDTEIEDKVTACDAEKLERVMLNLLSNSFKFTEPGGKIQVNIYEKDESIIISVKDTGIGIPKDMLEKIFETFRQVDSSLRRKAEGSGIGLSLAKSLVEMHGGKISAKSNYGQGSEFIIELPINLVPNTMIPRKELAIVSDNKVEIVNIEFSDIYS
jgi:PAS domain S-box-containing protein